MTHENRVHLSRAARPAYQALEAFSKTVGGIAADSGVDDRLKELVQIHGADSEALALQAWASVRAGEATDEELRDALTRIDRAVNADRTNDQAVYYRGLVHKRLGNVPSAFRDFARAMQLNPQHAEAEREVRMFAMRTRKLGSGEHAFGSALTDKLGKK